VSVRTSRSAPAQDSAHIPAAVTIVAAIGGSATRRNIASTEAAWQNSGPLVGRRGGSRHSQHRPGAISTPGRPPLNKEPGGPGRSGGYRPGALVVLDEARMATRSVIDEEIVRRSEPTTPPPAVITPGGGGRGGSVRRRPGPATGARAGRPGGGRTGPGRGGRGGGTGPAGRTRRLGCRHRTLGRGGGRRRRTRPPRGRDGGVGHGSRQLRATLAQAEQQLSATAYVVERYRTRGQRWQETAGGLRARQSDLEASSVARSATSAWPVSARSADRLLSADARAGS
jgi:hypothetical protein